MVYVRNIIQLFENMVDGEVLRIGFSSGKSINSITKSDKLYVESGDLVVERINKAGRCVCIIDPAEVENVNLITTFGDE